MKKQTKRTLTALPFIGALLMLSCEPQPGPYQFIAQLLMVLTAIALIALVPMLMSIEALKDLDDDIDPDPDTPECNPDVENKKGV